MCGESFRGYSNTGRVVVDIIIVGFLEFFSLSFHFIFFISSFLHIYCLSGGYLVFIVGLPSSGRDNYPMVITLISLNPTTTYYYRYNTLLFVGIGPSQVDNNKFDQVFGQVGSTWPGKKDEVHIVHTYLAGGHEICTVQYRTALVMSKRFYFIFKMNYYYRIPPQIRANGPGQIFLGSYAIAVLFKNASVITNSIIPYSTVLYSTVRAIAVLMPPWLAWY